MDTNKTYSIHAAYYRDGFQTYEEAYEALKELKKDNHIEGCEIWKINIETEKCDARYYPDF